MPTNKPNSISSLRGRFDPHYKLAGKVEGLEKGVSNQVSQIHKTISKSFVTQRKTLTRVLGLEKRVNHLEIQEAAEEQAKENLDDILKDIHQASPEEVKEYNSSVPMTDEEKEFVGEESKFDAVNKSVATKKKPKAKKSKISASAFKKGTSQESLEERVERIAQNKVDEAAAEQHKQTSEYQETTTGVDPETGEALSPEERKRRFKLKKGTISTSKFFDKEEPKALPEGEKGGAIVSIGNTVESIVETLKEDQKQDKKHQNWIQKISERFRRRKRENKLEFKVFDGLKKTATKLLAPMKGAWEQLLGFLGKVILGRVLFKIMEWMGNKENQGKLQSIIKFFKDWWPAMLAGYLLFGNAFTGFAIGLLKNLVVWGAKLLSTVIPQLMKALAAMGPLGWGLLATGAVVGGGIYLANRNKGEEKGGENVKATGDSANVEATGDSANVGDQEVQKMNKGGVVPGRGNTDTVPAMLTPGEFVMSKGAVQKYGVNTMESMNAAAGGTNRPTMGRYETGGLAKEGIYAGMSTDEMMAVIGPSLEVFMEQNNAMIDSNPDAIYGEHMRLEMDRDGKMINFGKTIANMSEWGFNEAVRIVSENESIPPELKHAFLKKMAWVRKGTLDNPNFKSDIAFDINKDIPGTAAHRLLLKAQADTTSIAAKGGISAVDRARLMNRRNMSGGGLVQAASNIDAMRSPAIGSKKFSGSQLKNLLEEQKGIGQVKLGGGSGAKNVANIKPRKTATVITPSEKKKNVIVAYEEEKQKIDDKANIEQSSKEIPSFNELLGRSPHKIKTLGISV